MNVTSAGLNFGCGRGDARSAVSTWSCCPGAPGWMTGGADPLDAEPQPAAQTAVTNTMTYSSAGTFMMTPGPINLTGACPGVKPDELAQGTGQMAGWIRRACTSRTA